MQTKTPEIWTVAQLTRRIKGLLEQQIGAVWVSGEISNWKLAASGHAYFTLKDADSQIDAVMFRGRLSRLKFAAKSGLEVVAQGQVSVYERRGNYQIILNEMQPKGVGALQLAFEQLKAKLSAEGLFAQETKQALPMLPKRIGVVTSPTGAAIRDILQVINRRFGNVHVLIHPARVQGEGAAPEIVAGIQALDAFGVDVMIVGRGGGSLEDLWPFNEEAVVRAVYAAKTPIISAVGHEIDFSLTDFVADMRAPTPSAAAELVVREQEALLDGVRLLEKRLTGGLENQMASLRHRVQVAQKSFVFRRPGELLRQPRQRCDELRMRLEEALRRRSEEARSRLDHLLRGLSLLSPTNRVKEARQQHADLYRRLLQGGGQATQRGRAQLSPIVAQLDALSPLAILSRGYALAWKLPEAELLRDAGQLQVDDEVRLRFGAGGAVACIQQIEEASDGSPKGK